VEIINRHVHAQLGQLGRAKLRGRQVDRYGDGRRTHSPIGGQCLALVTLPPFGLADPGISLARALAGRVRA